MRKDLVVINRKTGQEEVETIYGGWALRLLHHPPKGWQWLLRPLSRFINTSPLLSKLWGTIQKTSWSRAQIAPFVQRYHIDPTEWAEPLDSYSSFDAFFSRRLRPEVRPIAQGLAAVMPADGRYRFIQQIEADQSLYVKGSTFSLARLLGSQELAHAYVGGTLLFARLCPTDYHRFHFPCDGMAGRAEEIPGHLWSVNPLLLAQETHLLAENRRMRTLIQSPTYGQVAMVEVGATCVGTIHQTYSPHTEVTKGEEKGYFSFGGSALLVLFEPGRLTLAEDLLASSSQPLELLCQMGEPLGFPAS